MRLHLVLLVSLVALLAPGVLDAQELAEYIVISSDIPVRNGHIIALEDGEHILSSVPYSPYLRGVIALNPALAISNVGSHENAFPVVTNGTVDILVNMDNGPIATGDFITSSTEPGIGMKADRTGFVLGVARAPFSFEQGETGAIPVALDIKFVTSYENLSFTPRALTAQLQDIFAVGLRAVASEPNTALRYLAAALVLIASLAFAFLVFGRAATNGIIATGRNPLAKKAIFVMVIFNIGMTAIMAVAGLVTAIFILAA